MFSCITALTHSVSTKMDQVSITKAEKPLLMLKTAFLAIVLVLRHVSAKN